MHPPTHSQTHLLSVSLTCTQPNHPPTHLLNNRKGETEWKEEKEGLKRACEELHLPTHPPTHSNRMEGGEGRVGTGL